MKLNIYVNNADRRHCSAGTEECFPVLRNGKCFDRRTNFNNTE